VGEGEKPKLNEKEREGLTGWLGWLALIFCLVSSWSCGSFFGPAFSAVNWSGWVGFEGDFAFLTAFRAGCLVHFFLCHDYFSTPWFFFLRVWVALGFICGGLRI